HSGPSGNGLPVQTARSDICGTVAAQAGVVRLAGDDQHMFAWLEQLITWEDRHRQLMQRLAIVLVLTALVDIAGTIAEHAAENGWSCQPCASAVTAPMFPIPAPP